MKRAWLATALLAASWLVGTGYYHQADYAPWAVMVALAAVLLIGPPAPAWPRAATGAAIVLLIPAAALSAAAGRWALLAGPALMMLALSAGLGPARWRWARRISLAALTAGGVLVVQRATFWAYECLTARTPNLPDVLTRGLAAAGRCVGLDVAADGAHLAMFSMLQVHRLAATWALLADPVSVCFLAGGIVLIAVRVSGTVRPGRRAGAAVAAVAALVVSVVLWLPVRALLLMCLYMHRVLLAEYEAPYTLMGPFWNAWIHLALLVGPVLLAWRLARVDGDAEPVTDAETPAEDAPESSPGRWRRLAPAALALGVAAAATIAVCHVPIGRRKPGRILVDDARSQLPWPGKTFDTTRTDKAYDTAWYGHASGYNCACLYDYCSRFYEMSRLSGPIDAEALDACDVLFLKVPSGPYTPGEVDAVRDFVARGGGLLLLGEHTNVFGSGVYLNRIAVQFGFRFRHDCLFGIDSVFEEKYTPPLAPHPIVQHMGPLDFATSCSIDPGTSPGRAAIRGAGLKNLGADWHVSNYYPQTNDQPRMRYGPFVQLWTTHYGRGRVAAFTDSTIFANFSAFEPGKSELMLGMLEWLNHSDAWPGVATFWMILAAVLLAALIVAARRWKVCWPLLAAGALAGWAGGIWATDLRHAAAMGPPQPRRPMVRVAFDRTVSAGYLPKNGFISGRADGFGLFERSVLRLGYFTFRAEADRADQGDVLVVTDPGGRPAEPGYVDQLAAYVENGGKLLVLDSPRNAYSDAVLALVGLGSPPRVQVPRSTANDLLKPFGLSVVPREDLAGDVAGPPAWPAVPVEAACEVRGGTPVMTLSGRPVAAVTPHGKGLVVVVGFSSRFTDVNMGVTGDIVPGPEVRKVLALEFALLRAMVAGKVPTVAQGPAPQGAARD